ncbi:MAG: hypothetical protein ACLP59_13640 [Bryobacteraceae bacterium]
MRIAKVRQEQHDLRKRTVQGEEVREIWRRAGYRKAITSESIRDASSDSPKPGPAVDFKALYRDAGHRALTVEAEAMAQLLTSLADISDAPLSATVRIAGVLFELGWIKSKPHEIAADASWKMTVISDYMEVVHKETRRLVAAYEQGPDPAAAQKAIADAWKDCDRKLDACYVQRLRLDDVLSFLERLPNAKVAAGHHA